jgi:ketosteroid isomerase-like protein
MDTTTNADLVRACFAGYRAQDRPAMERLLADDLVFTSPQDDRIDRAAWFERCFPLDVTIGDADLITVVEDGPERVFSLYRYRSRDGSTYANTEVHTVRDGQVHEIQVFFGGKV